MEQSVREIAEKAGRLLVYSEITSGNWKTQMI